MKPLCNAGVSKIFTMAYLYLDCETVPFNDQITEKELKDAVPGQYKKDESIEKYLKAHSVAIEEKIIKERSLDPLSAKVICISFSFNGEEVEAITGSEDYIFSTLNTRIIEFLDGRAYTSLFPVGHNFKKFDGPIFYLRSCKYKITLLKQILITQRTSIIDTMQMGAYFVHGEMLSLAKLCEYFGIPSPKNGMDGSKVYKAFKEGRIEDIANYCNKDVEALIALHQFLMA